MTSAQGMSARQGAAVMRVASLQQRNDSLCIQMDNVAAHIEDMKHTLDILQAEWKENRDQINRITTQNSVADLLTMEIE